MPSAQIGRLWGAATMPVVALAAAALPAEMAREAAAVMAALLGLSRARCRWAFPVWLFWCCLSSPPRMSRPTRHTLWRHAFVSPRFERHALHGKRHALRALHLACSAHDRLFPLFVPQEAGYIHRNALLASLHGEMLARPQGSPARGAYPAPTNRPRVESINSLAHSDPRCADCSGYPILNNPIIRCQFWDKQGCQKAWHKFRCAVGKLAHAKYVVCMEHHKLFEDAAPSGTNYVCPDATDATIPPIPPLP